MRCTLSSGLNPKCVQAFLNIFIVICAHTKKSPLPMLVELNTAKIVFLIP